MFLIMRNIIFIIIALLLPIEAMSVKREHRSVWMSAWISDWPTSAITSTNAHSHQKFCLNNLDSLQRNNFTTVYFHVRAMCDAAYDSKYEPWAKCISGARGATPAFDPLRFLLDNAHERGIEVYAWFNPYRYSSNGYYGGAGGDKNYENSHPDWLINDEGYITLNPALPEVKQRVVDVIADLLSKYDVDGVVFDDYFYSSGLPMSEDKDLYDKYVADGGTLSQGDWRRENVNDMVRMVNNFIKENYPWVRFGIGPAGVAASDKAVADKYGVPRCTSGYDSQYNEIFCDPLAWLSAGTIDYISPQIYWARGYSAGDFRILCPWWYQVADKFGRHCYVSHSLEYFKNAGHSPSSREKTFAGMAAQVQMNRDESSDAPGSCFYSYSCVDGTNEMENGVDFFTYMKNNKFQDKALTPCISWKEAPEQGKVANLRENGGVLEWDAVDNMRYAVYLLPEGTSHDGRLLNVAKNLKAHLYYNRYELPEGYEKCEAAVAIVDRYGNRYSPQWISVGKPSGIEDTANSDFAVRIEGNKVVFPAKVESVDVYDTVGKQLASYGDCSEINLEEKDGIVILRIDTGERIVTQKVSIK